MSHVESEQPTNNINRKQLLTSRIIGIIIGIFLLFSALSKTQPITSFISTIYNTFPLQFTYVTLLAQFIVSLEAALGIMLIMGLLGKRRWVLWVTQLLFIVFTIFVIYLWIKDGENADCGCLGDWVKLSPLETLLKNILLIILTTFLLFKYKPKEEKSRHIFTYVILIILFFYTLLFYPAELDMNRLYDNKEQSEWPTLTDGSQPDLRNGKYIICFMSFTCKHCLSAAQIISEMKSQDNNLPIIFIFSERSASQEEQKNNFFNSLTEPNIPYFYLNIDDYKFLAGQSVPSIFLIDNQEIDKKYDNYKSITLEQLQDWLKD